LGETISKLSELVQTKKRRQPLKCVFVGKPKTGKTTLVSSFVKSLLGDVEKSAERYGFPRLDWAAIDFPEILNQLRLLYSEDHDFNAFHIDSADWLEQKIWIQVLKDQFREQWKDKTIDDIGFAKGRIAALKYWQQILSALDALHSHREMHVGFVTHAQVRTVINPLLPEHDRWEPKLDKRASGLLTEWAELIGFLDLNSEVYKQGGEDKVTIKQERVLYVAESSAYLAGNRFGLTDPIINPDYETIVKAISKK